MLSRTGLAGQRVEQARWVLLGLVALAVLVRLPGLGDAFYGDEGFSLTRDSNELVTTTEDRFRPVFFTLLYLWRQAGFHSEVGLRALPFVFGVAQVPVAWAVGRRIASQRVAEVWTLLVATSPMLIEFSQELRMYSLVTLVALAQAWTIALVRERGSLGRWAAFAAVALVGAYTHLHYWLFLGGVAALLFAERGAIRPRGSIAALGVVAALYLPNAKNLMAFSAAREGKYFVHIASAVPKALAAQVVGFNYFALGETGQGRAVSATDLARNAPLIVLASIPIVIVGVSIGRRATTRPWPLAFTWSGALWLVPFGLASALTVITKQYWLHPKYVIYVVPFVLLVIAEGYVALASRAQEIAAAAGAAVVIAVALVRFWQPQSYGRREDWRGAARILEREATRDDALIVLVRNDYDLLRYYWPEASRHWALVEPPMDARGEAAFADLVARVVAGKRHVFYVRWDTIQNDQDPLDLVLSSMAKLGAAEPAVQLNPRLIVASWRLEPVGR
jgi:hypothetical protein